MKEQKNKEIKKNYKDYKKNMNKNKKKEEDKIKK